MTKPKVIPRWEAPPTEVTRTTFIDKEVAAMKRHPGRWMKVREAASGGAYRTYSKRGCEVRSKTVGENLYDLWARWPEVAEGGTE